MDGGKQPPFRFARSSSQRLSVFCECLESRKKRVMGFEPTTFSLATRCSTTELHPQNGLPDTLCPAVLPSLS